MILCTTLKAQASNLAMRLKYQRIDEELTSDICGINHNAIPNTLRMPQYQPEPVAGFDPARVLLGSDKAQPLLRSGTKLMPSMVVASSSLLLENRQMEEAHDELSRHAERSCGDVREMNRPYVQAIKLMIQSMDELETHQLRCPEARRSRCAKNSSLLLKSEWCKTITEGGNTVTALRLKLNIHANIPKLQTKANLMEWKKHIRIFISPAPDTTGMMLMYVQRQHNPVLRPMLKPYLSRHI